MQGTTLAVGILGCVLVLLLRLPYALAAYVTILVWYPNYLRVSIGTIDISAGRIVVTVLLLRCLCDKQICGKFSWSRLDTLVALSMVVYVGVYCITHHPLLDAVENRSGFLMDTWFSYLAARLILTNKWTLISFTKTAAIILTSLAILGVIESVTFWQPFLPLRRFRPWTTPAETYNVPGRWGFGRANGPFGHSILFGGCFVMFLPLIWALRHQRGHWGKLAYPLSAMAILGAISSMSSGPWGMLLVVVFCLFLEKYRRWTKVVLACLVVLCIFAEVGSNRPLYHVIFSYLNLTKGDWWQRAKLIDLAVERIDEWWLAGYGGNDPGWGRAFGKNQTDGNNEFLMAGVNYGMLGIVALCAVLVAAFRGLVRAFRETTDEELGSLYWAMGSTLVGVIALWQGVSFFGQMPALFYSVLGMIGASFRLGECGRLSCRSVLQNSNSNLALSWHIANSRSHRQSGK